MLDNNKLLNTQKRT